MLSKKKFYTSKCKYFLHFTTMDPYSIIKFAQNALNIALFFEKLAHCMSEEGRKVQGLTRKLKVITTIGQEP